MMNAAATVALGCPTSLGLHDVSASRAREPHRKRNWRFKLETSMVSISITWMSPNPSSAKFARISHPSPPAPARVRSDEGRNVRQAHAPMTRILHLYRRNSCVVEPGAKPGSVNGPARVRIESTCW